MLSAFLFFLLVRFIFYLMKDKDTSAERVPTGGWRLRRKAKKGITLDIRTVTRSNDEEDLRMSILRFSVNGIIDVVHADRAVTCVVRFYDITKGTSHELPIYSTHHAIANERAEAVIVFKAFSRSVFCIFTDFEIGLVSPHFLHCPYHGESTILAKLTVIDTTYPEIEFGTCSATFTMTETSIGYVAIQEIVKDRVKPICDLVATILTRDEPVEHDVVTGACAYVADLGRDALPWHLVESIVQTAMEASMRDAQRTSLPRMDVLQQQIAAIDVDEYPGIGELLCSICFFCYGQLGRISDEAQQVVSLICARFDVPRELMLELRDSFIRTHMYDADVNPILAEMPEGLDRDQQIQYLHDEYRRWRQRVTNVDQDVVREATHRLELIASLRASLSSS